MYIVLIKASSTLDLTVLLEHSLCTKQILLPTTCMFGDQETILGIDRERQLVLIWKLFLTILSLRHDYNFEILDFLHPILPISRKKTLSLEGTIFDTKPT